MKLTVLFTLFFVIFGLEKGKAYNANERYQLLRDKINLSSLHGPLIDEDFFFSLSFVNSSNLKALLEEASSLKAKWKLNLRCRPQGGFRRWAS